MVLAAICSIQIGAAVATEIFDQVGPAGGVFLRALVSALLRTLLWRPSFRAAPASRRG